MKLSGAVPFAALAFASLAATSQTLILSKAHVASSQMVTQTPPMGWNSWNFFHDKVDDKAVRAAADSLVASGIRDAGYTFDDSAVGKARGTDSWSD
jgi:alpha-galactosidase